MTKYTTTIGNAPLSASEADAIDRAFAGLKHLINTVEFETAGSDVLKLTNRILGSAFALRATVESGFAAANRRAYQPKPKPRFNRGYAEGLQALGLTPEKDTAEILKQLGLTIDRELP